MEVIIPRKVPTSKPVTLVGTKTTQVQGQGTKKKSRQRKDGMAMVMYRHVGSRNQIVRTMRWFSNITTSAGGIVSNVTTINSSSVTNTDDWSGIAVEFGQYRIKQIIVKYTPTFYSVNPSYNLALYWSRWWAHPQTTRLTMASDPGFNTFSSIEEFEVETNWLAFPDAHLYTDISNSIPAEQQYGFAFMSNTTPTAPASVTLGQLTIMFVVEFQGTL
jgi:hypothetical protein